MSRYHATLMLRLCLVLCCWFGLQPHASANTPNGTKPSYELHIAPLAWWQQLRQKHQPGIVMSYGQWKRHWSLMQKTLAGTKDTQGLPPVLQHMSIEGTVQGQQLKLVIQCKIKQLSQGWQWMRLPLKGIGLASFSWTGLHGTLVQRCPSKRPCRNAEKQLWLALRGPAKGVLTLKGGVPIQKTPQGRLVHFQVPKVAASTLRLQLPGQQELQHPLRSLQLQHDAKGAKTTWISGSLNGASRVKLLYRPLEAGTKTQTRLAISGQTQLTLHPHFQWLSATIQLRDRLGQRGQYAIPLPKGFRLLSLRAPKLVGIALDAKRQRLQVRLGETKIKRMRVLSLRLVRQGTLKSLEIAPLGVLGAYSQTGHISIAVHRSLKARITGQRAVHRIPLPKTKQKTNGTTAMPGAARMRFRYWKGQSQLTLSLQPTKAQVEAKPNIALKLSPRQAKMTLHLQLHVREGRLLELPWQPPIGWQLNQLTLHQRPHKARVLRYQTRGKTLVLKLPRPLAAGTKATIVLTLSRRIALPHNEGKNNAFAFALPTYKLPGIPFRTGQLTLAFPRDYEGKIAKATHIAEKTTSSNKRHQRAFTLLQEGFGGALHLRRKTVRIQMLTVSHHRLQAAQLNSKIDVYAKISGASIGALTLGLVRPAKSKLQFRAATGRIVERKRLSRKGNKELWQLKFARERFGPVKLEMSINQTLREGAQKLQLPQVEGGAKIETERGFVSVSAAPHTRVMPLTNGLNPLDPLLLPAPLFGKRQRAPLFAYHFQQPKRSLTLALRPMQPKRLLIALVQELKLQAQLQDKGTLRVKATIRLKSKGIQAFEATLPAQSELWSATINNVGIKPMRQGQRVRIPLPPHTKATYTIALHYSTKGIARNAIAGTLQARAPTLPYPVQDTSWYVRTPSDYTIFAGQKTYTAYTPHSLLRTTLEAIHSKPLLGVFLGFLVLLFFLRARTKRLFGAVWSLFMTLLRLGFAFLQYIFGRWYRWGLAAIIVGLFIVSITATTYQLTGQENIAIKRIPQRFSKLILPKDKAEAKKDTGPSRRYRLKPRITTRYKRKKRRRHRRFNRQQLRFPTNSPKPTKRAPASAAPVLPAPPPPPPALPQGNNAKDTPVTKNETPTPVEKKPMFHARLEGQTRGGKGRGKSNLINEPDAVNKPTNQDDDTKPTRPKKAQRFDNKEKGRISRRGVLGMVGKNIQGVGGLGRRITDKTLGRDKLGNTQQGQGRQTQQQRMLQWMMRSGESKMMRGIRSINLAMPALGARLSRFGTGLISKVQLTLWHKGWLRWLMLLSFFGSLLLGLLLAWRCPRQRVLFFWSGLLLSGVAGFLASGIGIISANAITLGILATGLLVFLGRAQPPKGTASIALAFFLVGGATLFPANADAAPQHNETKTPKHTTKAPTEPCALPFATQRQSSLGWQLPSGKATLFMPQMGKGSHAYNDATPVIVPHRWWALMRSMTRPCQRKPKAAHSWVQSHYNIDLTKPKRARGTATYQIRVLTKGWHRVSLGLRGARLQKQTFTSNTTKPHIRYQDDAHGYEALLQGPSNTSIVLHFTSPKRKRKQFTFQAGPAQASTLSVKQSGKQLQVNIPRASGGIYTKVTGALHQSMAYLGQRSRSQDIHIKWRTTQQNDATRHEAAQVFETTHIALHKHLLRLRSQFALSYRFRRSDRYVFQLPKGAILERLVAQKMRRWYIKAQKDGSTQLTILLHRPVPKLTITLQAAMLRRGVQKRHVLPLLKPIGVSQHTGLLGIRCSKDLQLTLLGADGLEKRSPRDYFQTTGGWGGSVQEAYTYRRQPKLTAILRPRANKLKAIAQVKIGYVRQNVHLRAHVQYTHVPHTTFVVSFAISAALRLHKIDSLQGARIRQYWLGPATKGTRRLFVELRKPLRQGQRLILEASRSFAKDTAPLPLFLPREMKRLQGTLMLYVPKDIEAQTEGRSGLDPIEYGELPFQLDHERTRFDKSGYRPNQRRTIAAFSSEVVEQLGQLKSNAARLLYRFRSRYQGQIQLRKEVSTATCAGEITLQVEEHAATIRVALRFQATGAGKRAWSLTVPQNVASQLQWTTKPPQATLRRSKPNKGHVTLSWQLLQPTKRGHMAFQYRIATPKSGQIQLGNIAALGTTNTQLKLLIKKGNHIRLHLPNTHHKAMRKMSLGALPATLRAKHRDIIAAYRIKEKTWRFSVKREILRTAIALQPMVEMAELKTVVAGRGQAWTQATYTLRSPGLQTVTLQLPPKATLWQIDISGQDLRPAKNQKGHYILPLPPKQTSDLAYQIRILYAHPMTLPTHYGALSLQAPKLSQIDTSETFWIVRLPYQYKIAWDKGNMEQTLRFHIVTQQLKGSITFAQKLKKMAAVGTRQQQWRARRNLIEQQQSIKRQLNQAIKAQRDANRYRYGTRRQSKLNILNNDLTDLRQSAGELLRTPQHQSNSTPLDPTAHWKQLFHLRTATPNVKVGQMGKNQGYFKIARSGKSHTYVTVGGNPQLTLTVYRRGSLYKSVGWIGWVVLLLLCLFAWRKWFA